MDATSRRQVQAKADRHLPDIDWKAGSYATATSLYDLVEHQRD
ncbi:MAG: hypothetical protein U0905_10975 [Pirellulales bacterium]